MCIQAMPGKQCFTIFRLERVFLKTSSLSVIFSQESLFNIQKSGNNEVKEVNAFLI